MWDSPNLDRLEKAGKLPGQTPSDRPKAQPGTKEGYGRQPLGKSQQDCKKEAEKEGGVAWDEHAQACWLIYGKAVKIARDEESIQEGFETVNFNFRTNGTQPAVPDQYSLPGPSDTGKKSQAYA
jgi:hypothetical protein